MGINSDESVDCIKNLISIYIAPTSLDHIK